MALTDYVNTLQGADSTGDFSTGATYPAVGVPRGLTYWTPQTSDATPIVNTNVRRCAGFRATHSASPWVVDYGHFDVMPVVGDIKHLPEGRVSGCELRHGVARPNEFTTTLTRYAVSCEMTATRACGVLRFTYPSDAGNEASIVVQTGHGGSAWGGAVGGEVWVKDVGGRKQIVGVSASNYGGVKDNFGCWFVMEISGADVIGLGTVDANGRREDRTTVKGPRAGAYLRLRPSGPVTVKIATSWISEEQARLNLKSEVGDRSYEDVRAATGEAWEKWLGKVEVVGDSSERDRRTLYSCMYRAGLFPTAYHEFDDKGEPHYASPYNGRTQSGVMYTNNGFWDTYRAVYPLLGVIDPDGLGEILRGFLNAYRDGGWLPKWCAPGYREVMLGTHTDAIFADAIARGIEGFDVREAYEAISHNALVPGEKPLGRPHLLDYHKYGYYPSDLMERDSVAWTLDNTHCDWCVAQVARKLGHNGDADLLEKYAQNYRNLWDADVKFFRPKKKDGSWDGAFREFAWGGAYIEGGPWHERFHVPHDLAGLSELFGGKDKLLTELHRMLEIEPRYEIGGYFGEIHEMIEMAVARDAEGKHFGQYAHCNQTVHSVLFVGAALGDVEWTSRQVARVMKNLYTPDGFPGDEDNGSMASWYVLGALGKAPMCVGSGNTFDIAPWTHGAIRARPTV